VLVACLTLMMIAVIPAAFADDHTGGTDNTCGKNDYPDANKVETGGTSADNQVSGPWGSASWDDKTIEWTINPGASVDLCVKVGSGTEPPHMMIVDSSGSRTFETGVSHVSWRVPPATTVIVTAPSVVGPTCDAPGSLVVPAITGVIWTGGANGDGPGTYNLTATAAPGYTLSGQTSFPGIVVAGQLTGSDCTPPPPPPPPPSTTTAIVTAPSVTGPTCDAPGSLVVPTITGVIWTGGVNGDGPGTYDLAATAAPGYSLSGQTSFSGIVVADQLTGDDCDPLVETVEICEFNPDLLADDENCVVEVEDVVLEVCEFDENLMADDEECVAPEEIEEDVAPEVVASEVLGVTLEADALPRTGVSLLVMLLSGLLALGTGGTLLRRSSR
jgi:hypothetical protein